jgi:hypothetical protein
VPKSSRLLVLLAVGPLLLAGSSARAQEAANVRVATLVVGLIVPVDLNGPVEGGTYNAGPTVGEIGPTTGAWIEAKARVSPRLTLHGGLEWPRPYNREWTHAGGSAQYHSATDHQDTVLSGLIGFHDKSGAYILGGVGLAFGSSIGKHTFPRGASVAGASSERKPAFIAGWENKPAFIAGWEKTVLLRHRVLLTFGARVRFVMRGPLMRNEGIGHWGLTPRIGVELPF